MDLIYSRFSQRRQCFHTIIYSRLPPILGSWCLWSRRLLLSLEPLRLCSKCVSLHAPIGPNILRLNKHTCCRPLLLRCSFSACFDTTLYISILHRRSIVGRDSHLEMLQALLLVLVPGLQVRESLLEIPRSHNLSWVVCRESWTAQSLSQNFVAGSQSFGIEGRREDLALRL